MRLTPLPAFEDNYIWLMADANGRALVVDPGDAEPVEQALARDGLTLTTILLTHHHADHTGGVAALRQRHDVRVFGPDDARIGGIDVHVAEGDQVVLPEPAARFAVWWVPGHTRTHVAYVGEGLAFTGDTLFSLGCGRLFEGSPQQMLTAMDRLAALPEDTLICCAHEYTLSNARFALAVDPDNAALAHRITAARAAVSRGDASLPTTIADERAANPFLRVDSDAIIAWAGERVPRNDRTARFAALRAAKDGFRA
ncbi:MAG TPA: hydroxyacylglutathione hydrolase [Rhodanobacteraceae bacterium]